MCSHTADVRPPLQCLVDLYNVSQHTVTWVREPPHVAPFNPISILQSHLRWDVAPFGEIAPHLRRVSGWKHASLWVWCQCHCWWFSSLGGTNAIVMRANNSEFSCWLKTKSVEQPQNLKFWKTKQAFQGKRTGLRAMAKSSLRIFYHPTTLHLIL